MSKASSIGGRVEALIRRMDGAPLCDDCIAERLDLSSLSHASIVTSAVGGTGGFERLKAPCSLCGATKLVIRHQS